jgi:phage shock protein C
MSNYEPYAPPAVPAQAAPRTLLVRSQNDKMIAGVCGGFADFTGLDANVIRIVLVAATILGAGFPVFAYLAALLLMPQGD